MTIEIREDNLPEQLAVRQALGLQPVMELLWGMGTSRVLIAAARLGILARLAKDPATLDQLITELSLAPEPTRLLLNTLAASGYLTLADGSYDFSEQSRKWLDPASPISVNGFVEHGDDLWNWWAGLEDAVRDGHQPDSHRSDSADGFWRRYITAQYELARLSAWDVAGKIEVPPGARTVLDVAGGHGWFSAELCRLHPALHATVVDLPGSAAVGRDIIAANGMADRVTHVDGDALTADLGGPYDVILCYNLVHHLSDTQASALMKRLHDALSPDGMLAVLDMFAETPEQDLNNASMGLLFYLTSGGTTYTAADLHRWLADAGFGTPTRISSPAIEQLYTVRKPSPTDNGRPA
jgi:2-polyprenyl-3-methyl-5-hydroxy-6-metoxy-1,4-benzoquinol methylase